MPRFADNIQSEANEQRRLLAAGEAIPPELRHYARKAGLGIAALTGGAALALGLIGVYEGTLYYGAALFCVIFMVIGMAQVVTGRHLVTGTARK